MVAEVGVGLRLPPAPSSSVAGLRPRMWRLRNAALCRKRTKRRGVIGIGLGNTLPIQCHRVLTHAMSPKHKLLERMQANPRGDWGIADVEALCTELGLSCNPPKRGSHFKVSSEFLTWVLTVPQRRPIKPVYIRHLVRLGKAHLEASKAAKG